MRSLLSGLASFLLCWLVAGSLPVQAESPGELPADALARRLFHRAVGQDMQMAGTMMLIDAQGHQRLRSYQTLRRDADGQRQVLIRFTAPADIAGTAFLVLESVATGETEQHLYLPALKRSRRIVASQKGRSFVNSDFTYEDMQRQPLENWTYRLAEPQTCLERPCQVLVSTPKPATDTAYGQVMTWVDEATAMPLKIEFYDPELRHCKSYRVERFSLVEGIATEMVVVMEDLRSGHQTSLRTEQIRYNSGLPASLFTTRALEP
ncbi:outer membrane lipoprotein-sorting protein [Desulfuromonas thiophila]|uniref:outer membrane lipoprotein-sorting protein n=1 Tax=Desulfuromonas thiophila TaxID=57664 RepID=UPI0024A90F8E|nr:outer membrane lipoprotein-sorting protein [Desulfuromonas thiophila]